MRPPVPTSLFGGLKGWKGPTVHSFLLVCICVSLYPILDAGRVRFSSRQYVLQENGQTGVCKGKGYRQAYPLHVYLRNHDSVEFGNYITDWEGVRHPLRPYGL